MGAIELKGVDKVYPGGRHAVRSLDLTVRDGELLVLLGPSGCGKSTILRLIAGLEPLTAGEIRVGGRRVDGAPPRERDVAMVFQSYALYGHMSVLENLEFPLRMRGVARDERRRRAREVAAMLEMDDFLDVRPAALSGGQQQRVAMGRALVREPQAFLLDEPLSNLDARLRTQLRGHIGRLQARLGVTTVYVTHDQVEALSLGHRVAVLREGRVQQLGPGQELYDRPANTFVAGFIGQPGMNLLDGRLRAGKAGAAVVAGGATIPLAGSPAGFLDDGAPVVVGVRPESFRLVSTEHEGALVGRVTMVESLGSERILYVEISENTVAVRVAGATDVERGARVGLAAEPAALRLFDGSGVALGA